MSADAPLRKASNPGSSSVAELGIGLEKFNAPGPGTLPASTTFKSPVQLKFTKISCEETPSIPHKSNSKGPTDKAQGLHLQLNNKKLRQLQNKSPEKQPSSANKPPIKSIREKNTTITMKASLTHRTSQQQFTVPPRTACTNKPTPTPLFKKAVAASGLNTNRVMREKTSVNRENQ